MVLSLCSFCSIQLLCLSPLRLLWFMVTSTLEFCFHFLGLFLACGGSHWALYTPSCFLLVHMFAVPCGYMELERLCFRFMDLFFTLCGGSLWALYTLDFCFFVLAVFFSSAWLFGSDSAKRGLYTAFVCSHASRHALFRPANLLVRRVDSRSAIFETYLLGILLELFSFLPGRTRLVLLV